jgi:hypothetical protein
VFYNKSNEGVPYNDGTSGSAKKDDMVAPNSTVLYTWTVPDHVAPTDQDPDCLTMVYTSAVHPVRDVYSGRNFLIWLTADVLCMHADFRLGKVHDITAVNRFVAPNNRCPDRIKCLFLPCLVAASCTCYPFAPSHAPNFCFS